MSGEEGKENKGLQIDSQACSSWRFCIAPMMDWCEQNPEIGL